MPRPTSAQRLYALARAAVILALLLSLSGCVYLRMLRFKNQLRDFDEFIEVSRAEGLSLRMRKPVLEDGDFVFVTDSGPTELAVLEEAPRVVERWVWRFEKKRAEGDARGYSMDIRTEFTDGLLSEIAFEPRLLEALPGDFLLAMIRSMGKAKVNKLRRSATAAALREDLEEAPFPAGQRLLDEMGPPTEIEAADEGELWRYTFNFFNPESGANAGEFHLGFVIDPEGLDRPIAGFVVTGHAR